MTAKHILVAGGTGFIGQALVKQLLEAGVNVTVLGRELHKIEQTFSAYFCDAKLEDAPKLTAATWAQLKSSGATFLTRFDALINLAGCNIGDQLWSEKRKLEILNSRIDTSNLFARLCAQLGERAPRILNASAIGIYGLQNSVKDGLPPAYDEDTTIDYYRYDDFLSKVGRHWELASKPAKDAGVSVTHLRFGVVLGPGGGVLKRMILPFYVGLGGRIGTGHQPFSWVAQTDVVRAITFLLEHPDCHGPFNIVSPECVTQKTFAKMLGESLHRPTLIPTPALAMKILFGQMGKELLLAGQHVYPKRLLEAGFTFEKANLKETLDAALQSEA